MLGQIEGAIDSLEKEAIASAISRYPRHLNRELSAFRLSDHSYAKR